MSVVYFLLSLLPLLLSIFAVALLYFLLLYIAQRIYPLSQHQSVAARTQQWRWLGRLTTVYLFLFLIFFITYCFRNSFYSFLDGRIWWVLFHYLLSVPILLLLRYQEKETSYRVVKLLLEILFGFLFMQAAIRTSEQWF